MHYSLFLNKANHFKLTITSNLINSKTGWWKCHWSKGILSSCDRNLAKVKVNDIQLSSPPNWSFHYRRHSGWSGTFVNPCSLLFVTFLSFICSEMFSRIIFIVFPGLKVRLIGLWFTRSPLLAVMNKKATFTFFQSSGALPECYHDLTKIDKSDLAMISARSLRMFDTSHQVPWTCACPISKSSRL